MTATTGDDEELDALGFSSWREAYEEEHKWRMAFEGALEDAERDLVDARRTNASAGTEAQ